MTTGYEKATPFMVYSVTQDFFHWWYLIGGMNYLLLFISEINCGNAHTHFISELSIYIHRFLYLSIVTIFDFILTFIYIFYFCVASLK